MLEQAVSGNVAKPRPKALILCSSADTGGGPQHVYDLARAFAEKTQDRIIIGCPAGIYLKRFQELGLETNCIRTDRLSLRAFLTVLHLLRKERPELINSFGKGAGLYGRLAGAVTRLPVVHVHQGIDSARYSWLLQRVYYAYERFMLLFTDALVHTSSAQQQQARLLHMDSPCSFVISPAVDFDKLACGASGAESQRLRESLGMPSRAPVIGTIARIDPAKDLEVLLRATTELRREFPNIRCLIAGAPPKRGRALLARLRQFVQIEGLNDIVLFLGHREDVPTLLRVMNVFVSSSRSEGFPIAMAEALASRCPVVATRTAGALEQIEPGRTGLLVPIGDSHALASAVAQLLRDPDYATRLGEAGAEQVRRRFTREELLRRTRALYRSILEPLGDNRA